MGNRLCVAVDGGRSCTSRPGGVVTEDGYQGRVAPEFLAFILGLIDGQPVTAAQGGFRLRRHRRRARRAASRPHPMARNTMRRIFEDGLNAETLIGLIDELSDTPPPPPPPEEEEEEEEGGEEKSLSTKGATR